jgi:hypothetical protein
VEGLLLLVRVGVGCEFLKESSEGWHRCRRLRIVL